MPNFIPLKKSPTISAHIGDAKYKGLGTDQNIKTNHGTIIGANQQKIDKANNVIITNFITQHIIFYSILVFLLGAIIFSPIEDKILKWMKKLFFKRK